MPQLFCRKRPCWATLPVPALLKVKERQEVESAHGARSDLPSVSLALFVFAQFGDGGVRLRIRTLLKEGRIRSYHFAARWLVRTWTRQGCSTKSLALGPELENSQGHELE
jgi:hypothetical protein